MARVGRMLWHGQNAGRKQKEWYARDRPDDEPSRAAGGGPRRRLVLLFKFLDTGRALHRLGNVLLLVLDEVLVVQRLVRHDCSFRLPSHTPTTAEFAYGHMSATVATDFGPSVPSEAAPPGHAASRAAAPDGAAGSCAL